MECWLELASPSGPDNSSIVNTMRDLPLKNSFSYRVVLHTASEYSTIDMETIIMGTLRIQL